MLMQEDATATFQCMSDCGQSAIVQLLWLIPALPIVASGAIALLKQPRRKVAATLSIGSLIISLLLSLAAFAHVLSHWFGLAAVNHHPADALRETFGFTWLQMGT